MSNQTITAAEADAILSGVTLTTPRGLTLTVYIAFPYPDSSDEVAIRVESDYTSGSPILPGFLGLAEYIRDLEAGLAASEAIHLGH